MAMVGLSPSVAGADGVASTLPGLLQLLNDPKAAKTRLDQLSAQVEEARQQTAAATATIAQSAARKKELEELQAKLDEGHRQHAARHDELDAREAKLNQGLAELTNKEAALGQAKRQYLEESTMQSKKLEDTAIASGAAVTTAAAKIKADRDEFERSVAAERSQIAALLKSANSKNEEAQQALADATALKDKLASKAAFLQKALVDIK